MGDDLYALSAVDMRMLSRVTRLRMARLPSRFLDSKHPQFVSTKNVEQPSGTITLLRHLKGVVTSAADGPAGIYGPTKEWRDGSLVVLRGKRKRGDDVDDPHTRSTVAGYLLRWAIMAGATGCYTTATDLTDLFMEMVSGGDIDAERWGSSSLYSALAAKLDVVVIDRVGAEPSGPSGYRWDQLGAFIERRMRYDKTTIITTNLNTVEWVERYSGAIGMITLFSDLDSVVREIIG